MDIAGGAVMNKRIDKALELAHRYHGIAGEHHKTWLIDQMVRALTGCQRETVWATDNDGQRYPTDQKVLGVLGESDAYRAFVRAYNADPGHDAWDVGIAP